MKRSLFACGALLLLASCEWSTVVSSGVGMRRHVPPDTLTLRVGQSLPWRGIEVGFEGVSEDSRCPSDAVCVWQGDAVVEISAGPGPGMKGPTYLLALHTGIEPRAGEAWGARFRLLDLQPAPSTGYPVPADSFVVIMTASGRER